MNQKIRDRLLQKKRYAGHNITESQEFPNVAFEVKDRAINTMIIDEHGRLTQFAGEIADLKRFFREGLEVCEAWEDIRT